MTAGSAKSFVTQTNCDGCTDHTSMIGSKCDHARIASNDASFSVLVFLSFLSVCLNACKSPSLCLPLLCLCLCVCRSVSPSLSQDVYFDKIVSNQTDNTSLIWKVLNALTKTTFSGKQTTPNALTSVVFNEYFSSLAESLTSTLQKEGDLVKVFARDKKCSLNTSAVKAFGIVCLSENLMTHET